MSAELIVRSEIPPLSWQEFIQTHPTGSIALDGYVEGAPQYEEDGPYLNVNHHENVDRLSTLSTAQQVLIKTRMGLDKAFRVNHEFAPKVYVNDCDQDVCAAWFLLKHIELAKNPSNPALNRFIQVAGTLDATAGAFPYDPDLEIMTEQAWVFQPYTNFRNSGQMGQKDNARYRSVIESVELRIQQHLMGRGDRIPLDTDYKKVGGGDGWSMIVPLGKDGKIGAFLDGVDAYVTVQELDDEQWRYSIGRRSPFIPFPLNALYTVLNTAEGCSDENCWGGSDIAGGSPRVGDSKLTPSVVEKAINDFLTK